MIVNAQNLRSLYVGFSAAFQGAFSGVAPTWNRVAMEVPSTTRLNEYGWLGQFPKMREWIGDRVVNNLTQHNYQIVNRTYESTIGVKVEDIEDDNVGIYTPMFQEFGRSAAEWPDELTYSLLPAGFTAACYDGRPFFDTAHPVTDENGNVNSVSNFGGGGGTAWYLLDTSRAIRPFIFQNRRPFTLKRMDAATDEVVFTSGEARYGTDGRCAAGYGLWQLAYASRQTLNATNFGAAYAAMEGLRGDRGRLLGIRPRMLVVPPSLREAAQSLLNAEYNANGATNVWRGTAELMVVPWL